MNESEAIRAAEIADAAIAEVGGVRGYYPFLYGGGRWMLSTPRVTPQHYRAAAVALMAVEPSYRARCLKHWQFEGGPCSLVTAEEAVRGLELCDE